MTKEELEIARKNGMSFGEEQQLYLNKEENPIELYVKRNGEIVKFVRYEQLKELQERIDKAIDNLETPYFRECEQQCKDVIKILKGEE